MSVSMQKYIDEWEVGEERQGSYRVPCLDIWATCTEDLLDSSTEPSTYMENGNVYCLHIFIVCKEVHFLNENSYSLFPVGSLDFQNQS